MNEQGKLISTFLLIIFFVFVASFAGGYLTGKYNPSAGPDDQNLNSEIADIKQSIVDRFAAINKRLTNLDGALSAIPGQIAAVRSGIVNIAGNIENSIRDNRAVIEQLEQLGAGIGGIEERIRGAQIGAGEINAIIGDIEAANGIIEKTITGAKSSDLAD